MIQFQHLIRRRPIVPILIVAALLYSYQLGAESLSIIESYSLGSARGPLNHFNRPLYFWLLRGWMQLGINDAWLRGLSVLFGLVCIGLTYKLGEELTNRTTGAIAALLLTLSPLAVYVTQEVRFYMMSACLGVAGSYLLVRVLRRGTIANITGWLLLRCLGVLTAQVNILLLVPDGILLLAVGRSQLQKLFKTRYAIWLGLLAIPAVILAWDIIPPLIDFLSEGGANEAPGLISIVQVLSSFTAWPSLSPVSSLETVYDLFFKVYALATLALIACAIAIAWRSYPKGKLWWVAVWGFAPLMMTFIVSQGLPRLWDARYLFVVAPYISILLAAAIGWLLRGTIQRRWLGYTVIALIAIATISSLTRYYTYPYREDWRSLVETIARQEQNGDAIIVYPDFTVPSVEHYYDGQLPIYPIDLDLDYPLDVVSDITPQNLDRAIANLTQQKDRFWLVFLANDEWGNYQKRIIDLLEQDRFALRSKSTFYDQWDWGPVLYLFAREQVE